MKVPLTQGAYTARSIIAEAQRCVNLFPELNPEDAPFPLTHYLSPGLTSLSSGTGYPARCQYQASNGVLFEVIGADVYATSSRWVRDHIGTITLGANPVSMKDNGLVLVIVDGSASGWCVDLSDNTLHLIVAGNGAFYGADKVDYIDTFFLFNRPGTQQWYTSFSEVGFADLIGGPILTGTISAAGGSYTNGTYTGVAASDVSGSGFGSGATLNVTVAGAVVTAVTIATGGQDYQPGDVITVAAALIGGSGAGFHFTASTVGSSAFDPLDIAAKVGAPDKLATLIANHREVWLLGEETTEVWYDAGNPDFAFQEMPGVFIQHGCDAIYSVSTADLAIFWLGNDPQGHGIVFMGENYQAKRISTHAIENEFASYPTLSDAIGFCYQQQGHIFYQLTFPTADKTWVYDLATKLWHERSWCDDNGLEHRHRASTFAFAYGTSVVGDWQTGELYELDPNAYTDVGQPIVRRRGFPHLVNDGKRAVYHQFIADMEPGTDPGTVGTSQAFDDVDFIGTGPIVFDGTGDIQFYSGGILSPTRAPNVSLRWSDTRGRSWGNPVLCDIGAAGDYLRQVQKRRLGIARDRVFELFWDGAYETALNGAYIEVSPCET